MQCSKLKKMKVYVNGRFFKRKHFWFEKNVSDLSEIGTEDLDCDEIVIHGNLFEIKGKDVECNKQESLLTDLSKGKDELWLLMTKTTRNEINRAERDGVVCCIYSAEDVVKNDTLLKTFSAVYERMYAGKGIDNQRLSIEELRAYAKQGALLISVGSINDNPIVFHSYVIGNESARLLHSCSEFRDEDNAMRNAIGRANRYLHWNDMMQLQQMGIKKYDWGGVSSIENPNGIDKFKLAFGGEEIRYYNIEICNSICIKVFKKLRNFVGNLSK